MTKEKPTPLAEVEINPDAAALLGASYATRFNVLPFHMEGSHLWVAMPDTSDLDVIRDLSDVTGFHIIPVYGQWHDIRFHIDRVFRQEAMTTIASRFVVDERLKDGYESVVLLGDISSAPVVKVVDSLIDTGIINRASDIHIEPYEQSLRVRYRLDGRLVTFTTVDISILPNVVSRLKVMGGMDIAQKRQPQDGQFTLDAGMGYGNIDFRLSTLPTSNGEKVVIRLLYGNASGLTKEQLGLSVGEMETLSIMFNQPHGAVFMTGPSGRRKTTTLNCFLREMNHEGRNIVTIEDPVENPISGVNHVHVARRGGLGFAQALRHILRQDPDVIMIGEIRDTETAAIAIQAAITGHVVLSTLHTNDAAGVIERLMDMGVEPYMVSAALRGVVSQRLLRKLCHECSFPTSLTLAQAEFLSLTPETKVYESMGCPRCNRTGFNGRFAVFEILSLDENMRRRIVNEPAAFSADMRQKQGMKSSAVQALTSGKTTVGEVFRVLGREGM